MRTKTSSETRIRDPTKARYSRLIELSGYWKVHLLHGIDLTYQNSLPIKGTLAMIDYRLVIQDGRGLKGDRESEEGS